LENPIVSVIMPVYNQAPYIGEAIESVLRQTYTGWQLIIVNDGSTDATADVIHQYNHPRIHYQYQVNQGVSRARNVGIRAASGAYITFLDADDAMHPEKIALQVSHLQSNSDLGLSYHSSIEMDMTGRKLALYRAPAKVTLENLLTGFPFTMNDFMVRKAYLDTTGGFNEALTVNEDRDLFLRLFQSGCRFARLDKFLAFRRLRPKSYANLEKKLEEMLGILHHFFGNVYGYDESSALYRQALINLYLPWSVQAFFQNESVLAAKYLHEIRQLDASYFSASPNRFLSFLINYTVRESWEPKQVLRNIFAQFPPEMAGLSSQLQWAESRGYLLLGIRSILWGRQDEGKTYFHQAFENNAAPDADLIPNTVYQLMEYESAFGPKAAQNVIANLTPYLRKLGGDTLTRKLAGEYLYCLAFQRFVSRQFREVPKLIFQAGWNNPAFFLNRGAVSIAARAFVFHHLRRKSS
jgi:glycosyltransferase involved in cell wall biosynthesis